MHDLRECLTAMEALNIICSLSVCNFLFVSDSQACFLFLNSLPLIYFSLFYLILEVQSLFFSFINSSFYITLLWIHGHVCMIANESVDTIASSTSIHLYSYPINVSASVIRPLLKFTSIISLRSPKSHKLLEIFAFFPFNLFEYF